MLFRESKIKVADNTGAKIVKCLNLKNNSRGKYAKLNTLILIVVQKFIQDKKVQKKKKYWGLIISTCYKTARKDGSFIKFDQNRVVLFSEKIKFLGTRVYGPLCKEIQRYRYYKTEKEQYKKLVSYSSTVI